MSKSISEFKRFLIKSQAAFSEYEKKLAKLVLDNFHEVEASGTAGGKRGKLIAKFIENAGDSASSDLNIEIDASTDDLNRITYLSAIKIKNFRGFSTEKILEFKNPYTFIYGPNGTGKSSLCEALEYCLLGSINEADAKRIDITTYIKNSITKKSDQPLLSGKTSDGKSVAVQADPKRYEFCFIEKNRIDGFARVAANTTAAQQVRLAALFGLEEFNGFSTQFNDNFENYIDSTGKKAKELADKEKQIAGHKAILLQIPEKEKEVKSKQDALLLKYPAYKALDEIKEHISGLDGNGGVTKKNHTEIGRLNNLKLAVDPGIDVISTEILDMTTLIQESKAAKQFLAGYKDQLSLGDLYSAILKNKEKSENHCPACESLLYDGDKIMVPVDPYQNATEKLKQFDVAIKKEARIKDIATQLNDRWPKLVSKVGNLAPAAILVAFAKSVEIDALKVSAENANNPKLKEDVLTMLLSKADLLGELKKAILNFNEAIGKSKSEIKKLENSNTALAKNLEEIVAIKTTIDQNIKNANAANIAIEKFKAENDTLIKLVEIEKPIVSRNIKYLVAYENFREKLLQYNGNLPLNLAADLNDRTLKYYNAINKNDHVSDRLKSLTLPTSPGKKIEIEFEVGQKCDALQILSEGHIRCLGLAILLSKIVRDDLPFLIFDDVVNSIDDEHRSGIIELILGDDEIKKRQLIITTHGEDFVKRLENAIPKIEYKSTVCRIDFLIPVDSKQILVKLDSPRHYLVVAEQSYQDGKIRDCLSYVRKSFEDLLNRLWKKIGNKSHTAQIQVGLRGPGGSPDLMAIASGLHGFLNKKEVTIFQDVIPLLAKMIGKESTHALEWNYLNKGTHEEDKEEEFDISMVKEMLELVMEIDTAVEKSGATPQLLKVVEA
ncbi:AAA family ATPase [Solimicrobium silvestre]|uniref:RecF/RecN/SMC N terminal domain n=1 Tax=Solimicrobium silvestre TaxID=2099400 RepID=A0A2S9H2Y0_9BURK|nr:AAA family ATPase [Solimicrobium silvestre]PRC94334.1 RecF/RecN/SMC N terminal domain [Solimicrobium silvestre]